MNFKLIIKTISPDDLNRLRQEVIDNDNLWLANSARQSNIRVQPETQSIHRAANDGYNTRPTHNRQDVHDELIAHFPLLAKFMYD